MTSSRSTVFIAIAIGAVLGAVGAVMSGRHAPDTRAEPTPPAASSAVPPAPAESREPAAAPVTSAIPAKQPDPIVEAIAPLQKDPAVLLHTELGCARGSPDDCLLVGDYYSHSDENNHKKRALIYRRRAIVLYAQKCHDRWPAACHVLSGLYARGIGVPKNNRTADALLQRSLELCKAHPGRPCMREGPDIPPDLR